MRTVLVLLASLSISATVGCDAFGYQERTGTPARAVFVLAHGLGATAELGFSSEVSEALLAEEYEVYRTEVPAFDSIENRASALAEQIDGILVSSGAEEIHIIGHSMGGLDSRYLISTLGYASSVASLTTIATPHRGSPVADYVLEEDEDGENKLDVLGNIFGDDEATQAASEAAVIDLSVAQALKFNAATPDAEGVRYVSWGGFATAFGRENVEGQEACSAGGRTVPEPDSLGVQFLPIASIVAGDDVLAHDGLVTVESAKWGEFMGCVSADHLDEVGMALSSEFDVGSFYRAVAFEVAP